MASGSTNRSQNGVAQPRGPHPSTIQVARPYYFEQIVQDKLKSIGTTESKEDAIRIQGVTWIDNVRKQLQLPVRTYNTACVYYHKFRLEHPDNEYHYYDAAAAALFNACKIEDTLKKSRDILCAAWNMRVSTSEHLSSDDPAFESHAKTIVGLERLMLEASGFDFRNRYPQRMLLKFVKSCELEKNTVGILAYKILLDLYRTFAPLKQTSQTMALACLELSIRLSGIDLATVKSEHASDYVKWSTTREEIMDLYTTHRSQTVVGPDYAVEKFLAIRITLNQESQANDFPRYTEWQASEDDAPSKAKIDSTKPSPKETQTNGSNLPSKSVSPQSPADGSGAIGERGKEGTLRFMLDPERARDEKNIVKEFFRVEEIEEFIEVEFKSGPERDEKTNGPFPSYEKLPMSVLSGRASFRSSSDLDLPNGASAALLHGSNEKECMPQKPKADSNDMVEELCGVPSKSTSAPTADKNPHLSKKQDSKRKQQPIKTSKDIVGDNPNLMPIGKDVSLRCPPVPSHAKREHAKGHRDFPNYSGAKRSSDNTASSKDLHVRGRGTKYARSNRGRRGQLQERPTHEELNHSSKTRSSETSEKTGSRKCKQRNNRGGRSRARGNKQAAVRD